MITVPRAVPRAVLVVALVAVLGFGLLPRGGGRADAQPMGLAAPPACQCSTPTSAGGLSVLHCVCGGLACVASVAPRTPEGDARSHQLQCVK